MMVGQISIGQTFVKQDATGTNDGSSWDNAYTDLNTALDNTTSGDIWIATGNYIPSTTFLIANPINIYGGFIGTETSIADRDIVANPTTLSGDINSDDIPNDFAVNKTDNATHVILVDSLITLPVTIDGFIISGGNTSDDTQLSDELLYRGGGIFAFSTVNIKDCTFSQNFAGSGAGVYVSPNGGGGNSSSFEGCTFSNNFTSAQSAGIFLIGLDGITVDDCVFSNNTTNRGAFYPNNCTNVDVTGCVFENNSHTFIDGFGGVLFNWQSTGLTFTDCEFRNNTGGNGGVMYNDNRNITNPDANNVVFENCVFEDNTALDFGGAVMYAWMSSYTMNNCTFTNNTGANGSNLFNNGGGAVQNIEITNSSFSGGEGSFGGGLTCYGEGANFNITNSSFSDAVVETSGGALICGFGSITTITDCDFNLNEANFGGAIYAQNDSTHVSIFSSTFNGNEALNQGGAIFFAGASDYTIDGSTFTNNATDEIGGAISVSENKDTVVSKNTSFMLTNSIFDFNLADVQGGALNLNNADAIIYNTQFSNNFNLSTDAGAGGAISQNLGDSLTRSLDLINCTVVNNSAPLGAGIAQFTGFNESVLNLNIQNTILFNPEGVDYEIEDGLPVVNSLGGNLSGDDSTVGILNNAADQTEVSDMFFVDIDEDYHLTESSPAIDAGVDAGAPMTDFDGNPRVGQTDAGAYEFQMTISTKETIVANAALKVLPNPIF